jgi:hypothetical protein
VFVLFLFPIPQHLTRSNNLAMQQRCDRPSSLSRAVYCLLYGNSVVNSMVSTSMEATEDNILCDVGLI